MDAGAASFRFNFDASGEADATADAAPQPQPPAGEASLGAREEFPSQQACHLRQAAAALASRVLTQRCCAQPPGADWQSEEVAIGADGFSLLKARRRFADVALRCARHLTAHARGAG